MAYGKIKADAIIYDDSGSNVETTIQSLATPDEGTAVKSTGESGTTKFLRVDGDGTCSWQVPPTVTVVDEDNMSSDSATSVPSQQSVKAYVDTADALKANLANPTFTGTVNAAALTLSGNLQVNGTTTTVASSTMTVTDKNIEIAKGAANDAAADGAGITVDSGDGVKTWNWVNGTDAWKSSEHIWVTDAKRVYFGDGADLAIFHSGTDSWVYDDGAGPLCLGTNNSNIEIRGGTHGGDTMAKFKSTEGVELYFNNSKKIETTAAGVTVTGTVTDSKGDVRSIPAKSATNPYTLVASDAGKAVSTNGFTITIPNNIFSGGDAVTLVNNSSSDTTITRACTSLYLGSDGTNSASLTLKARTTATIYFTAGTTGYISGGGLS